MKKIISQNRLKEALFYSKESGKFTWIQSTNQRIAIGSEAGCRDAKGRVVITLDGTVFFAHRLAWVYCFGVMPTNVIDHINGDNSDNRIENLRDVTIQGNSQNIRHPRKGAVSGLLGAQKGKNGRWSAAIKINGRSVRLGLFKTKEEAHAAYVEAKRIHHPTCTI